MQYVFPFCLLDYNVIIFLLQERVNKFVIYSLVRKFYIYSNNNALLF
jgi:hypothetical protein